MLKEAVAKIKPETVLSSFRTTGLVPFNPEIAVKRLPASSHPVHDTSGSILASALAKIQVDRVTPKTKRKDNRPTPGIELSIAPQADQLGALPTVTQEPELSTQQANEQAPQLSTPQADEQAKIQVKPVSKISPRKRKKRSSIGRIPKRSRSKSNKSSQSPGTSSPKKTPSVNLGDKVTPENYPDVFDSLPLKTLSKFL